MFRCSGTRSQASRLSGVSGQKQNLGVEQGPRRKIAGEGKTWQLPSYRQRRGSRQNSSRTLQQQRKAWIPCAVTNLTLLHTQSKSAGRFAVTFRTPGCSLSSHLHISLRSTHSPLPNHAHSLSSSVEEVRELAPSTARPFRITQVQGSRVKAPASTKSTDTTLVRRVLQEKQSLRVVAC